MALETLLTDGLVHVGAGIGLAMLDFLTYRVGNPKDERLKRKTKCLAAIEVLLDTENSLAPSPQPSFDATIKEEQEEPTPTPSQEGNDEEVHVASKDSVEYAGHVTAVCDYLRSSGIVKLELPLLERIKDGFRNLIFHEKINGFTNLQKLGVAIGVEVVFDIAVGLYRSAVPITALAKSLYQIPTLWIGLWLGNGIKKFLDIMTTSAEERKFDKAIQQLLQDTNIVEIIVKYTPPEGVQKNLFEQGINLSTTQLTQFGKGAFTHLKQLAETAKETAEDVLNYSQKKEEQQEQEREERKKRFDELTKGR